MPRPAYIAAHSPAGPAPTMITSYPSLAVSFIGPQFSVRPPQLQPRRFGIAGKRSLELRTKPNRFDLDIGSLPARQLFERAPAHRRHPMAVPALLMQQRARVWQGLIQAAAALLHQQRSHRLAHASPAPWWRRVDHSHDRAAR